MPLDIHKLIKKRKQELYTCLTRSVSNELKIELRILIFYSINKKTFYWHVIFNFAIRNSIQLPYLIVVAILELITLCKKNKTYPSSSTQEMKDVSNTVLATVPY